MITHKNAIAMLSGLVYLVEKVSHFAAKHCNYIMLRERKRNLTSSGLSALEESSASDGIRVCQTRRC